MTAFNELCYLIFKVKKPLTRRASIVQQYAMDCGGYLIEIKWIKMHRTVKT